MYDGVDAVALVLDDLGPALELYVDRLGFAVEERVHDATALAPWAGLLGLDAPPASYVLLGKAGSHGGSILLVEVPGAPTPDPAGAPRRPGPYALDFYVRDAEALEADLAEHGWEFTSPAVHYDLPGTELPVRERMLRYDGAGLLHALVRHRPRGTRSVLGDDPDQDCSEVVALVVLTDRLDGARELVQGVLGGRLYFDDVFAGPAVEEMLDLRPGEGLHASLFRGPTSANARLEFARPDGGLDRPDEERAKVVALVGVDDLDAVLASLADGGHGAVGPVTTSTWGGRATRAARLDTAYDLTMCLLERPQG